MDERSFMGGVAVTLAVPGQLSRKAERGSGTGAP